MQQNCSHHCGQSGGKGVRVNTTVSAFIPSRTPANRIVLPSLWAIFPVVFVTFIETDVYLSNSLGTSQSNQFVVRNIG